MTTTQAFADVETDTAAAFHAGLAAAEPHHLDEAYRFHVITPADGSPPVVIDILERQQGLAGRPLRKKGDVTLNTASSLVRYINRHGGDDTEVWADSSKARILAVIDGHSATQPGHAQHRATLVLRQTDQWKAWAGASGRLGTQQAFAELIEDRAIDVVAPPAATLLEIAQTFRAAKAVDFESSRRLSTGEVALVYREQVNATAGKKGELTIPETFELALAPYEGSPAYRVTARLRYRINEGTLAIGFVLERPADVLRAAFDDVVAEVENDIDEATPMFTGWPATTA